MFYFTPASGNGWFPRMSPDGRYLGYGNQHARFVDLFPSGGGGVPVETDISALLGLSGTNQFATGFFSPTNVYYTDFDGGGSLYSLALPSFASSVVGTGSAVLGNAGFATGGNWGRWGPPPPASGYVMNGVAWTPTQPAAGGLAMDGEWVLYAAAGNQLIVENVAQTYLRLTGITLSTAWRIFAGPDGGYVFCAIGPDLYINTPSNQTIVANLPGIAAQEGFLALAWVGAQLWVWTYSFNPDDGVYYALGRPVGDATCIQLANVAANNFSGWVGIWTTGFVVAGANDALLSVWADVPFNQARTSYRGSNGQGQVPTGGGGGGGGVVVPNPGGNQGTGVIDSNTPPPVVPDPPPPHPHVDQIPDWATKQSLQLAWDQLGKMKTDATAFSTILTTLRRELTAAQAQITKLQKKVGE